MTLDTRTLVAIVRRVHQAAARPLLFHDVKTPARTMARYDRILAWAGLAGRIVAWEHMRDNSTPPAGRRKWKRGGYWTSPEAMP